VWDFSALAPVFHFATKMFPSHSQLTMLSRIAHNTLAKERFCTFLQPVTTCDFKPYLARIVLAAQTTLQQALRRRHEDAKNQKQIDRLEKKMQPVEALCRLVMGTQT
jgi:hypothetical protein